MTVSIRLLGTIRFEVDDGPPVDATVVPTVKALDLLRLLVAFGDSWQRADHYISLLWPAATTDDHGRASLRTAVAQLRRALGPELVQRSGDLIGLGDARTDVARFRRLASQVEDARNEGDDRAVLSGVREAESISGELVVSGTSCDAVYALRDELQALRHQLLLDAAAAAARLGCMRTSLDLARSADDMRGTEGSARALMVALAGLGETRQAIETFERLRAQLSETYGVQPSPTTRALYLQVVTAGETCELGPADCHPDQAFELAIASARLQEGPDPGGVVWLHGEPGSGRGLLAGQAQRMVDELPESRRSTFELLPEVVAPDRDMRERLTQTAAEHRCVFVVPVRTPVAHLSEREHVIRVDRLDRDTFDALLWQLLQERPARALADLVWSASDGLAGQARRIVEHLVRDGSVGWTPGGMDLVVRERVHARRRIRRPHPVAKVKALCAPALLDLGSWLTSYESAVLGGVAV
ncbi:MAG TPA: BTAD domain-containing putative transcriptional regulator [Nocardioides sp.]|nr:BTAD domain-containing putative transcriptional regulator [Nocardioides sp.]